MPFVRAHAWVRIASSAMAAHLQTVEEGQIRCAILGHCYLSYNLYFFMSNKAESDVGLLLG